VQLPHYCLLGLPAATVLFVQQEPPPVFATVRNVSNSLAMPCFSRGHTGEARQTMLAIADLYEKMAKIAERSESNPEADERS
jgi:hypothetical protein